MNLITGTGEKMATLYFFLSIILGFGLTHLSLLRGRSQKAVAPLRMVGVMTLHSKAT